MGCRRRKATIGDVRFSDGEEKNGEAWHMIAIQNFSDKMSDLEVTDTEYAYLRALAFLDPGKCRIRPPLLIFLPLTNHLFCSTSLRQQLRGGDGRQPSARTSQRVLLLLRRRCLPRRAVAVTALLLANRQSPTRREELLPEWVLFLENGLRGFLRVISVKLRILTKFSFLRLASWCSFRGCELLQWSRNASSRRLVWELLLASHIFQRITDYYVYFFILLHYSHRTRVPFILIKWIQVNINFCDYS